MGGSVSSVPKAFEGHATAAATAAAAAVTCAGAVVAWKLARKLSPPGTAPPPPPLPPPPPPLLLVVVTGCDSGLGFSLALRALSRGLHVLAACLDERGAGARKLAAAGRGGGTNRAHVARLDVRDADSVRALVRRVDDLLGQHPGMELRALVNNAGVMVFGEFEWQTEEMIQQQVDVNLLGTMRVTKAFCPLLRQHKGRIITVTSHCATQSLPGLAVYGATKAALKGWCDGLRVEQSKYGVKVITLVPGYFMMNSNLMARHKVHVREMEQGMSPDNRRFFGDYFGRYHAALGMFAGQREPASIDDESLHRLFDESLLARRPSAHYRNSPLRYTVYHWLFAVVPVPLRDALMVRFMSMPEWRITDATSTDNGRLVVAGTMVL